MNKKTVFTRGTKGFSDALGFSGNASFDCSISKYTDTDPECPPLYYLNLEFYGRLDTDVVTAITINGIDSEQVDRMIQQLTEARDFLKAQETIRQEKGNNSEST